MKKTALYALAALTICFCQVDRRPASTNTPRLGLAYATLTDDPALALDSLGQVIGPVTTALTGTIGGQPIDQNTLMSQAAQGLIGF
ncbi:MAG TPA: hypothetical protein VKJ45_03820 [Blastocatellia bacterium]|nr:hypothetical protein [Blastocatellia bacterium]